MRSNIIAITPIKLIVGLRNPGVSYESTRHNAGGWFVEALAKTDNLSFKSDKKLRGEIATLVTDDASCILFMPLSFMNLSGECVNAICKFYQILPNEVLVVHDDLDLSVGNIRFKTGGGHGGHNGLRNIISHLGSNDFHRLRIGIGHPGHKDLVLDYVLGKPSSQDRFLIVEAIDKVINVISKIIIRQLTSL